MMNKNSYVEMLMNGFDVNAVKAQVKRDVKNDISEMLHDMFEDDEDELYDFLVDNDLADGIHHMDDLDNVFDYMSPTEVLEELKDIDLCARWFNEYSKDTSDYLDELWESSIEELAADIVDGEIEIADDDDINYTLEMMEEIIEELDEYSKRIIEKKNKAQALFDELMKNEDNIDTLLNILWTIND